MSNGIYWIEQAWKLYFEFGDKADIDLMENTMKNLIDIIYQQNTKTYPLCVMCGKVIHIPVSKTDIAHNYFYCDDCKKEYEASLNDYYNAMNKKSD